MSFCGPRLRRAVRVLVCSSVLACIALVSSDSGSLSAQAPAAAPVERAILDQADRQKGEATFWVIVREKANLAAAYGIQQRSVRGRFVYDQLTTVAAKSQAGLQALLRARGASFKPFWIANAIRVTGDRALIDELARRPEVERIVRDRVFTLEPPVPGVDEAQISGVEWGIDRIRAPLVWSTFSDRGESIVVASVDTGVKFDHPALVNQYRGNLGAGNFDHNYSWFDPSNVCGTPSLAPCDNNGHGTHTMGTMAGDDGNGNQIGVAPHVKWIAAKGCEQGSCSNAALLAAGQWILAPTDLNGQNARPDLRPHIVNNSWGSSNASDTFYQATVQAWIASGIFPAFSNGNAGPACGTVGAPAGYAESYGAGAFDINNLIAAFSSRGPAPTSVGASIKPDLAAPGVNIRSAWNDGGYYTISGTSMASPHLAGAVALMWSAAPSLIGNIAGTRALLGQTAIDTSDLTCGGTAANNNVWGEGRLDAFAAVGAAPRGPTGTLTGIVTDSSSSPIQGATIAVSGPTSRTTPTGSAGDYTVLLPVGSYDVAASAFGYLTQSANAVVINDGQTIALPFTLAAAPAHAISGHVTDSFLHPVAGATVTVLGAPATTDGNGFYSFAKIPEGTYPIKAEGGRCRNADTKALTVDADETVDFLLTARSDSFGYFCREETASYVEANLVVALTGDDAAAPINLPFPFLFYGQTYNSAQLATNGFLNFIASSTSFSNSAIPTPAVPNAAIYPYWDDLFADGSSSVRTDVFGSAPSRQFVIEWRNVAYFNDLTKRVDFEVILHENGQILIQYRNIGNDAQERGNSATVGIEDQTGSIALQYAVNEAALSDAVAIRYLLAPQAILQGTVTDTNDGLPIAGASVKAFQGSTVAAQTTTDANGFYRMPLLLGTYDLQALKTNYVTALASVSLSTPDGTVTRNLALKAGRLTVNPSTLEFIMTAGQARTANLALANTGTEGLTWSVSESPTAVSWLSEGSGGGALAAGSNATVLVGVNSTGLAAGVYDTTLLFSSDSGRQPSVTVSVRLVVSGYSKAIDAGGGAYTDGSGISWLADRVYVAGQYGYVSKQSGISTTTIAIAATNDDPLYQSARIDPGEYRFDGLPAGVYEVDLRFAEIQNQAPASRLFDILVEGKLVLPALDVAREVGTFTADRHVFFLSITDGKANIGFAAKRGYAKPVVSGLRLTHRPDK